MIADGLFVLIGPGRLWTRSDGLLKVSRDWLDGGWFEGAGDPELAGRGATVIGHEGIEVDVEEVRVQADFLPDGFGFASLKRFPLGAIATLIK